MESFMSHGTNESRIQTVVNQKVDADELFTAWDVSLEVQKWAKQAGEQPERHRQMKSVIHHAMEQFVSSNVYQQTLQDVGAPAQAIVYHPFGVDPTNYQPRERNDRNVNAMTPQTTNTATVTSATVDNSNDNDNDLSNNSGRHGDKRGTLTVPCYLLRAAGFNPRDTAYIYNEVDDNGSNVLVVSRNLSSGRTAIGTYTVDDHTNVRVTSFQLDASGVREDESTTYDFDGHKEKVYIKKHS